MTESGVEREGGLEDVLEAFPGRDPRVGRAFEEQKAEGKFLEEKYALHFALLEF